VNSTTDPWLLGVLLGGWAGIVSVALVYDSIRVHQGHPWWEDDGPPTTFAAVVFGMMWPVGLFIAFVWFCILRPAHHVIGRIVAHIDKPSPLPPHLEPDVQRALTELEQELADGAYGKDA
jgi:hypothetical protein